jgi:hypothetical protein
MTMSEMKNTTGRINRLDRTKERKGERSQMLTPVILATQKAEIRRTAIQCQPRQMVCKTLSQKKLSQKKRAGGVAEVAC